jgi:hypothetical protein
MDMSLVHVLTPTTVKQNILPEVGGTLRLLHESNAKSASGSL